MKIVAIFETLELEFLSYLWDNRNNISADTFFKVPDKFSTLDIDFVSSLYGSVPSPSVATSFDSYMRLVKTHMADVMEIE